MIAGTLAGSIRAVPLCHPNAATGGEAPTIASRAATQSARAGNGVFTTLVYRGVAVAADGTLVSARATATARYLGESASKLPARASHSRSRGPQARKEPS